jgi:hypothetical protein
VCEVHVAAPAADAALAALSSAREVRGAVAKAVEALRRRRLTARSEGEARRSLADRRRRRDPEAHVGRRRSPSSMTWVLSVTHLYKIGYRLGGLVKAFAFATVSNKDPFLSLPVVTDSLKLALNDTSSSSGRTGDLTPSTATTNQPPHRHIPTARAGMNLRAGPALSRADAYVCEAAAAYLGSPGTCPAHPVNKPHAGADTTHSTEAKRPTHHGPAGQLLRRREG